MPLGKITLFDFNTRNHSAEFGYYLPNSNRAFGLGKIMLPKFIEAAFQNDDLNLNKIYATTASNNFPSIKLLEKYGFKLEGRLREHYWINENKYDQLVYSLFKCEWTKGDYSV
jgi:ribosomal-protein-alanine N-acetyltransferase